MKQTSTHNQLIRQRLIEGGSISDLRREGLEIEKTMETGINRVTGKPVTFARYSLSKKQSITTERPNQSEGK